MTITFENTTEIRKALGPAMDTIRNFSGLSRERRETSRIRRTLLRRHSRHCAVCGKFIGGVREAEAAHILALEEGGETVEENLILLCQRCHSSYDKGRASVFEMRGARLAWIGGAFSLDLERLMDARDKVRDGQPPLFRPSPNIPQEIYDFLHIHQFVNAIKAARKLANDMSKPEDDRLLGRIMEANIERRRSGRGTLARAEQILAQLDPGRLHRERLPLFHYERGYLLQMLGDHSASTAEFEKSGSTAAGLADQHTSLEVLTARLRILAVETIGAPWRQLDSEIVADRLASFDLLLKDLAIFDQPFAGRWMHNILGWKWRYAFKCGDDSMANRAFAEYEHYRDRQTVATGYTRDSGSRVCGFHAMMILRLSESPESTSRAMRLVCRALASLLSYRIRPEGIRDYLLTFETALRRLDNPQKRWGETIAGVGAVRKSILDGSSFLDPYRA